MNVLFISHYSELYGSNRSLLAILDGLDRNSVTPFVLLPRSGAIKEILGERGITCFIFPFKKWMAKSRLKMPLRLLMNLIAIPIIFWKIKVWKIDLVYTNSSMTPVGAWTAYFFKLPHIWHIREFGRLDYGLKHDFGEKIFNYWLKKAVKIIAVSNSIVDVVLSNMRDKTIVVYNGVISKDEVSKLSSLPVGHRIDKEQLIFGIIGLLHPTKGQEDAIKAFAKMNKKNANVKLWIAGSGSKDYENYLKDLCIQLTVNHKVKFLGYVDHPFQFFSKVDVVLVCSRNEAMGRVTAEAMVAGKPIIGRDSAGTSELIDDGKNGLLYDGSISSLAFKMEFLLENDFSVIAEGAGKKGLNNFIIEDYAAKIEQEITEVKN